MIFNLSQFSFKIIVNLSCPLSHVISFPLLTCITPKVFNLVIVSC